MGQLARPVVGMSRRLTTSTRLNRVATLPITESAFARPDVVEIAEYKYPGNPDYPGIGPKALPEQWETEERTVHYMIPKTLVEFLQPKLGQTGLYTLGVGGAIALLSKEHLVWHVETQTAAVLFFALAATYDKFYACKEHDIAAYTEIVQKYKEAQDQAQGQALFNEQKLTNLALMLETE